MARRRYKCVWEWGGSVQVGNIRVYTGQKDDNTATFFVYNKHKLNLRDNTVHVVSELVKPQSARSN